MNQNNLEFYLKNLIKTNELFKFYRSTAWINLREEVLKEQHNECQLCKDKGLYAKATTVHHINYVRHTPRIALSKQDDQGKPNLIAVCATCHNEIHKSKYKGFHLRTDIVPYLLCC